MEKKSVRRRFFDKEFFQLMDLRQSAVNPEQRELAERKLRRVYASNDVMIFPFGEKARKRRIGEEIQSILKSHGEEASLMKLFHEKFLGREV